MNKNTFKLLFDQYYNPLCNYVAHHFRLDDEAEDIVMDVFTYIWDKDTDFENIENKKSYLYTAVYRKSIEYLQNVKILKTTELTEKFVIPDDNEQDFDDYLLKEKLYHSIRQLPTKCQLIFVKAKINGMSHKAISDELGISIKTIENQITKAYMMLRKDLVVIKK